MAAIEQKVEEIIANNKVAVFSKSYCRKYPMRALIYSVPTSLTLNHCIIPHHSRPLAYCRRAKETLKALTEFFVIELDQVEDGDAIQEYLAKKTGQRTVPNIFINQQHIGGCDDLLQAKASGKLQKLLA
jgi:glutaredoxin 3